MADDRLSHGASQLHARSARLLQIVPRLAGIPILLNIPAAPIVLAGTWLLYIGVKESTRANNIMVLVKLLVLGLFIGLGAMHIDPATTNRSRPATLIYVIVGIVATGLVPYTELKATDPWRVPSRSQACRSPAGSSRLALSFR